MRHATNTDRFLCENKFLTLTLTRGLRAHTTSLRAEAFHGRVCAKLAHCATVLFARHHSDSLCEVFLAERSAQSAIQCESSTQNALWKLQLANRNFSVQAYDAKYTKDTSNMAST